mgnify:CR=1 FL=1
MNKVIKAVTLLGINSSDIKDILQTPNLDSTELVLNDNSTINIKENKVSLQHNNKTLVTIKLK